MEQVEKEMTMWLTYHDGAQIEQYCLKEDDSIRLFKSNNMKVDGENTNHLNSFYSKMTTMYWVWKTTREAGLLGFAAISILYLFHGNRARRVPDDGSGKILFHYMSLDAHNYNDYYDIIDILNEKYGKNNKYTEYMLKSKTFIPFCFIMHYDDFEVLCEFFFPILFEFDRRHSLDMNADKYWAKA